MRTRNTIGRVGRVARAGGGVALPLSGAVTIITDGGGTNLMVQVVGGYDPAIQGQQVAISGNSNGNYNGTWTVNATINASTFQISAVAWDVDGTGGTWEKV